MVIHGSCFYISSNSWLETIVPHTPTWHRTLKLAVHVIYSFKGSPNYHRCASCQLTRECLELREFQRPNSELGSWLSKWSVIKGPRLFWWYRGWKTTIVNHHFHHHLRNICGFFPTAEQANLSIQGMKYYPVIRIISWQAWNKDPH